MTELSNKREINPRVITGNKKSLPFSNTEIKIDTTFHLTGTPYGEHLDHYNEEDKPWWQRD